MAVTVFNENLKLSDEQLEMVTLHREKLGYHNYYKGDGITDNPFTFNLSASIYGGEPSVIIVLTIPPNNKRFDFKLRHMSDVDAIGYESTVDASNKVTSRGVVVAAGTPPSYTTANAVLVTPGTHVFRVEVGQRGIVRFFLDELEFFSKPQRKFNSMRRVDITADSLIVYEAHYTEARNRRAYVFTGNGFEVPTTPALYPSTYIMFNGTPLDKWRRSWCQVRRVLSQGNPNEKFFIREAATKTDKEVNMVINVYEAHYAVWNDEGFHAVYPTSIRVPRSFSIYEFVMNGLVMCFPSS